MEPNWTNAQLSAINNRDKTLLVSAAAGSGKTATLTERIIRSITVSNGDNNEKKAVPADITKMLIVTFTRASAADLKAKISKALTEKMIERPSDTHLAKQLVALGSAHISTIDSFYYDVVKANFQKLSLARAPRIADEAETTPLYQSIMNETIEDFYYTHNNFERFMEHFTATRDNSMAAETFISMYDKLLSQKKRYEVLKDYVADLTDAGDKNIFETKYGAVALAHITAFVKYALEFTKSVYDILCNEPKAYEKYGEAFKDDLDFFNLLQSAIENEKYDDMTSALLAHNKIDPPTLRNYPELSKLRKIRNKNYESLDKIKKDYFAFSEEEISKSFKENAEICSMLYELLKDFDERIMREKTSRGICTFADLKRFVLELFYDKDGNPTDTAIEYRDRFDYIYIDEYQDVDAVQDAIFRAISRENNRFMVGDVKQSIYSFRNADPTIFTSYKDTLPPLGTTSSPECSLFMSSNFRCDETIIDFSNAVSSFLFSQRAKSIGYTSEDDLVFSKDNKIENYKPVPVTVAITGITPEGVKAKSFTDEQKEYAANSSEIYIATEILRLVNSEKLSKSKIEFGDIAILTKTNDDIPDLVRVLESYNIPVQARKESDFFENPDVLLVMALLSAIDNPQKDISLAGTLRSPFFGFALDDIIAVRLASDASCSLYDALLAYSEKENELGNRCKSFISKLNYWREAAVSTPCDKLIKRIYQEMSILSFGSNGNKNLLRLYEYAIKFEANGFKGLYGFIKYVEELIASGVKLSANEEATDKNCVKIMTIHKSKGLEFPVCFIHKCQKSFSDKSAKANIQFEPNTGISFHPHDESGFAKFDSPLSRSIIHNKLTAEKEEEMRLLYVAMTRAKERLYTVAKISNPQDMIDRLRIICQHDKEYAILSSNSYIEWIFAALEHTAKKNCYRLEEHEIPSQDDIKTPEQVIKEFSETSKKMKDEEKKEEKKPIDKNAVKKLLDERFNYKYPFEHVSKLPAKLAVSVLSPKVLDESDKNVTDINALEKDFDTVFGKDFAIPKSLHDEKKISPAERGTATHAFLQFCDFEEISKHGIKEEKARLIDSKFIDRKYAEAINEWQLGEFFKSDLYKRISTAKKVWREQRFNIFLPAAEFTEEPEKAELLKDETIAVQGVIDIFFEDADGKIVLCDYKTDYLEKEELADLTLATDKLNKRYKNQLSYYAKAIEAMLNKAPDEVIIYSLPLGKHVSVKL